MSPSEKPRASTSPVATIGFRVKELRGRRGWTAAQLGAELHKRGTNWDRFAVANLESGKRQNVTVQELLALALALDVAPVNLLVPLDNRPYLVTPTRIEDSDSVRAWVRGKAPLPGVDERTFLAESSVRDLWEQRYGKEPESLAELAEALLGLPEGVRQEMNRAWFQSHGGDLIRQANATAKPDDRTIQDLIVAAAALSKDPAAVISQMVGTGGQSQAGDKSEREDDGEGADSASDAG